jgi:hypothetical protein
MKSEQTRKDRAEAEDRQRLEGRHPPLTLPPVFERLALRDGGLPSIFVLAMRLSATALRLCFYLLATGVHTLVLVSATALPLLLCQQLLLLLCEQLPYHCSCVSNCSTISFVRAAALRWCLCSIFFCNCYTIIRAFATPSSPLAFSAEVTSPSINI